MSPDAGHPDPGSSRCPDCGAIVPDAEPGGHAYVGASPGCWRVYGELSAEAYLHPALARVQTLMVDAYMAQHSGRDERRANQSVWVHLAGLYLALERGEPPPRTIDALRRLADGRPYTRLDPPRDPAWMTVADVAAVENADERAEAVRRWAGSVWDAWRDVQPRIRALADS
jgi:hypothetical protein